MCKINSDIQHTWFQIGKKYLQLPVHASIKGTKQMLTLYPYCFENTQPLPSTNTIVNDMHTVQSMPLLLECFLKLT